MSVLGSPYASCAVTLCVQAGLLPVVHGSALGQQGPSQALVSSTLGDDDSAAKSEGLTGQMRQQVMVQLNDRVAAATEVSEPPCPPLSLQHSPCICIRGVAHAAKVLPLWQSSCTSVH